MFASLLFVIILLIFIATIINFIIQNNKLRRAQIAREQELIFLSRPKLQPKTDVNNPQS